jgi:hypothetical protein
MLQPSENDLAILLETADGHAVLLPVDTALEEGDNFIVAQAADGHAVAVKLPAPPAEDDPFMLAQVADGHAVAMKFEDEEPDPCPGQPKMLLTVTGTSGTINWCGETWVLPADSGVQKVVCPTTYYKDYFYSPAKSASIADHVWRYDYGTPAHLLFRKQYSVYFGYTPYYWLRYNSAAAGNAVSIVLRDTGGIIGGDQIYFSNFYSLATVRNPPTTPVLPASTIYAYSALGILTAGMYGTSYSMYFENDMLNNSYTDGGVTYSWTKGDDWPY